MGQFCVLGQKALTARCILVFTSPGAPVEWESLVVPCRGPGLTVPSRKGHGDGAGSTVLLGGHLVWCCAWGCRRDVRLRSVSCPAVPPSRAGTPARGALCGVAADLPHIKGHSSCSALAREALLGVQRYPLCKHMLLLSVGFASRAAVLFSLQPPSLKVLSRSPMSDASDTWECKAQGPLAGSEEQQTHRATATEAGGQCLCPEEQPDGALLRRPSAQNGMQDTGAVGTGVKKKRKKKDLGEQEGGEKATVEVKPKRRREPKEPKEPKKAKEPKKQKEPKQREVTKKPRKPREPKAPKEPKDRKSGSEPGPRTRPKKSRWVLL